MDLPAGARFRRLKEDALGDELFLLTILGSAFWSTEHGKYCASPHTIPIRAPSLPHTGKFLRKKKKFAFLLPRAAQSFCTVPTRRKGYHEDGAGFGDQDPCFPLLARCLWLVGVGSPLSGPWELNLCSKDKQAMVQTWSRWDLSICWVGGKERLLLPALGGERSQQVRW